MALYFFEIADEFGNPRGVSVSSTEDENLAKQHIFFTYGEKNVKNWVKLEAGEAGQAVLDKRIADIKSRQNEHKVARADQSTAVGDFIPNPFAPGHNPFRNAPEFRQVKEPTTQVPAEAKVFANKAAAETKPNVTVPPLIK